MHTPLHRISPRGVETVIAQRFRLYNRKVFHSQVSSNRTHHIVTMNFRYILHVLSVLPLIVNGHYLTATAITEDEKGTARLECWKFTQPFHTYPTVGRSLPLANVSNVTYVALPPRSGEGIHNPPHPMWVTHFRINVWGKN